MLAGWRAAVAVLPCPAPLLARSGVGEAWKIQLLPTAVPAPRSGKGDKWLVSTVLNRGVHSTRVPPSLPPACLPAWEVAASAPCRSTTFPRQGVGVSCPWGGEPTRGCSPLSLHLCRWELWLISLL